MSTGTIRGPRVRRVVSREQVLWWTVLLHLLVLLVFVLLVMVLRPYGYDPVTALGLIAATAAGAVRQILSGVEQAA
ncbi:hypothetical protein I6A60_21370 [Frankia sp. AgB1.9]|uniref:hypothetical protein n=1 Tax=unclassified Frankia TaxID=2632575 RepID=UPI001931EFDF|nr:MULTISPECIES: hypothetical protein [unclassified Frankia]MBL7487960.1 hypothetical protein [Frankia sp. AgW1.1]MBL7550403.1 hypothetical protein [Frankia sp. AgB1.9]MBL7620873.1 hypothetical protein [Frankia sp. AgB1.8]